MNEKIKNILVASQAIAIWVVAFAVIFWLCFRPSDNLNKETLTKLTDAVDKFSVATGAMSELAKSQQEFTNRLSTAVLVSQQQRDKGYGDLYKKYGVDGEMGDLTLDDLYGVSVQQPAEGDSGRDVHRDENGTSKAGSGKNSNGVVKGQPH